jgi:sugar (pentulose or hexulose) kinase
MKKKIICIIDFGQSHLKFNLITQNYRVTRTLIFKNNFVFSYNNSIFYDHLKITKKIKFHINKISENYHIIAISFVGHGSACFYIDEDNVIKNGFHFSSNIKNNELKEFNKISLKFSETFTPNYKKLHNLGKNLFLINRKNINFKFMTLTSFLGWIFSKKNIIDPSYISCHTYLWNFKKKIYSDLVGKVIDFNNMPKIEIGGKFINKINNKIFKINKNCKIYNGIHDTSAAFYFHKLFFKKSNTIFLSTGTTFVFGKFLDNLKKISEKSKFYYLNSIDLKKFVLSRRFHGGLIFKRLLNRKCSKTAGTLLAKYTFKELKWYLNDGENKQITLVIDGPFSQNNDFLCKLKALKGNMSIYCAKNKNSPSLGIAHLCNKNKINLTKDNYYSKV